MRKNAKGKTWKIVFHFHTLKQITFYVEMAALCNVPKSFLVHRGQGIKLQSYIASQGYKNYPEFLTISGKKWHDCITLYSYFEPHERKTKEKEYLTLKNQLRNLSLITNKVLINQV